MTKGKEGKKTANDRGRGQDERKGRRLRMENSI